MTRSLSNQQSKLQLRTILAISALATALLFSVTGFAERIVDGKAIDNTEEGELASATMSAAWDTRPEARSLHLKLPAPRGQIVDRFGSPFAQNKIGYYAGLQMPTEPGWSDARILAFTRDRLEKVNKHLKEEWVVEDERILNHYRNRRWLPLLFSPMLKDSQVRQMKDQIDETLILFPTYQRYYPQGNSACHMIGYSGRKSKASIEMLISGEPLYSESEGRDGLELTFDEYLRGTPGERHCLYGTDGERVFEEQVKDPEPGSTVVLTLDMRMQKLAESTLRNYCRRGAFVVIDVETGDVLAMASNPTYDPNLFIPGISKKEFAKLREDKNLPMFARAFRGVYPPASTFKIPVALAALEAGVVDRRTTVNCPSSYKVGNRYFRNWNGSGEGRMSVVGAIMRSCNTWFYKVGLETGADNVSSMAFRLGYGEKTGLPLRAEAAGFIPTNETMMAEHGIPLSHGYLANACIGQGHVLATPLQVAQMMAGVGNRRALPQVRLVQQIQGIDGELIEHFPVEDRHPINVSEEYLDLVTQGMIEVVSGSRGTAPRAANSYYQVCGKTGTGQWGAPGKKQYVAWFAGFVPANAPRYAFVALYEGSPGESLSGGKKAAPMVSSFFNKFYGGGMHRAYGDDLQTAGELAMKEVEERKKKAAESGRESIVLSSHDRVPVSRAEGYTVRRAEAVSTTRPTSRSTRQRPQSNPAQETKPAETKRRGILFRRR